VVFSFFTFFFAPHREGPDFFKVALLSLGVCSLASPTSMGWTHQARWNLYLVLRGTHSLIFGIQVGPLLGFLLIFFPSFSEPGLPFVCGLPRYSTPWRTRGSPFSTPILAAIVALVRFPLFGPSRTAACGSCPAEVSRPSFFFHGVSHPLLFRRTSRSPLVFVGFVFLLSRCCLFLRASALFHVRTTPLI